MGKFATQILQTGPKKNCSRHLHNKKLCHQMLISKRNLRSFVPLMPFSISFAKTFGNICATRNLREKKAMLSVWYQTNRKQPLSCTHTHTHHTRTCTRTNTVRYYFAFKTSLRLLSGIPCIQHPQFVCDSLLPSVRHNPIHMEDDITQSLCNGNKFAHGKVSSSKRHARQHAENVDSPLRYCKQQNRPYPFFLKLLLVCQCTRAQTSFVWGGRVASFSLWNGHFPLDKTSQQPWHKNPLPYTHRLENLSRRNNKQEVACSVRNVYRCVRYT